jgi:phage tail sheath protein FI
MPATYSYPGVYVEELPSGVRTIVGVSTSETAFVDFFARGPIEQAVRVTSFGDFERTFGGLDTRSEASYAIRQYYLNGGQIAWVVRAAAGSPTPASVALTGTGNAASMKVNAANEGAWGNELQVSAVKQTGTPAGQFDLFVRQVRTVSGVDQVVATEAHRNLSMVVGSANYAKDVVAAGSTLIALTDLTALMPTTTPATDAGGPKDDSFTKKLTNGKDGTAFNPDGTVADTAAFGAALKTGMTALDRIEPFIFNLLCLPASALLGADQGTVIDAATKYCADKRAFFIVDIPAGVTTTGTANNGMTKWMTDNDGKRSDSAAVYFPRIQVADPLNRGRPRNVGPSGTMAGVYARTDATRGVWKAPAGTDAALRGATLTLKVTDLENGGLNPIGINVLRNFPIFGNLSWGARTLDGADSKASQWKYIPVRRTALFIEESLFEALKWVVFEPNDEPLWAQIRLNVGVFMHGLFRQGAFQGTSPRDAYFVKCDKETTTQADIDRGIVHIVVGFAPLKPAEFVVIQIQQIAGQLET